MGRVAGHAEDYLLDASVQARQLDELKQNVDILAQNVQAGGQKARWENIVTAPLCIRLLLKPMLMQARSDMIGKH